MSRQSHPVTASHQLHQLLDRLLFRQRNPPERWMHALLLRQRSALRRLAMAETSLWPRSRSSRATDDRTAAIVLGFLRSCWDEKALATLRTYAVPKRSVAFAAGTPIFAWPTEDQYFVPLQKKSGRRDSTGGLYIHKGLRPALLHRLEEYWFPSGSWGISVRELSAARKFCEDLIEVLSGYEDALRGLCEDVPDPDETHCCLTLRDLPPGLLPSVLQNAGQRREWKRLLGITVSTRDGVAGLLKQPLLVVDTAYFDETFRNHVFRSPAVLQRGWDGVLCQGDSLTALHFLRKEFHGAVRCIYVDPPFNTGAYSFLYNDRLAESEWLTMMANRIGAAVEFLTTDGSFFAHIDYGQKEQLRLLLDRFLRYQTEIIWRIGWISGFKSAARKFIRNHDTIYHYARTASPFFQKQYLRYPPGYVRRDGVPPRGKGYPLEDTWNCSELDRLDSIQIMSFSREKVGERGLTQKNENLLERIVGSCTEEGDVVLDCFAGSGTTCAVAHKMHRRWIGVEIGPWFETVTLPRMKKVLAGDPRGISRARGWQGGGMFVYHRLPTFEERLKSLVRRFSD